MVRFYSFLKKKRRKKEEDAKQQSMWPGEFVSLGYVLVFQNLLIKIVSQGFSLSYFPMFCGHIEYKILGILNRLIWVKSNPTR